MEHCKILVIDNEKNTKSSLSNLLISKGHDLHIAENGKEGLAYLKEKVCTIAFIEMHMDDLTALEFMTKAHKIAPDLKIIVMTSSGSIENAVELMHLGAAYYLTKPVELEKIAHLFDSKKEVAAKRPPPLKEHIPEQTIIAESKVMKSLLAQAIQVAQSQANVFITGESGTGKEVIANVIHYHSLRNKQPYIRVNCAAIPETLIESEFFGHEKGSFTGATGQRLGRFELADNGSLLLDEVTEIPLALQSKLLRVVQELEFERVGGMKSIKVNVRLISTSNRDIKKALEDKALREDLFYRLNVIPIHIPPLRERPDDIIPLAEHFLKKLCKINLKEEKKLSEAAAEKLLAYPWPGNIRELANAIERTIVLTEDLVISPKHLNFDHIFSLDDVEKRNILELMQKHHHDRALVAKLLGISQRKLSSRIETLKIELPL